jgi:uncharacterized DUF497 family protein
MSISFESDAANIAHIAEHDVLQHEAEEAATYKPVALPMALRNGEERFVQIGETYSGRILLVVTTPRTGMTRVVTAHDVDLSKRKFYALRRDVQYGDREENSS